MLLVGLFLALLQGAIPGLPDSNKITVIDGGPYRPYNATEFDAGPVIGDMLNAHFFPAVNAYNTGRYRLAMVDFTYVTRRGSYLDGNPRQGEFLSTAYYLRGMIYLYHTEGLGRHALAKADFENAIKWNPSNQVAYVELSRVYSDLGFTEQAILILNHLLELKPRAEILEQAQVELAKLKSESTNN